MALFHGWGSTASRLEPLRGGSFLFTIKFQEIPGTLIISYNCFWVFTLFNWWGLHSFLQFLHVIFEHILMLQFSISIVISIFFYCLTLSWRRSISHRKLSIDLQGKSVDWFLYDRGLRHERVKVISKTVKIDLCEMNCITRCIIM